MRVYNKQMIIPTGTVMNADLASEVFPLVNIYGFAVQVKWTGTPTGAFKLQVSADPPPKSPSEPLPVPATFVWSDLANSSYSVNAAGDYMWNVYDTMYNYVRLVYTDASSGASTAVIASATINAKGP